jgi:catechol 2,3-dioxygenase-like lactoylglutathione lyase family enzyme
MFKDAATFSSFSVNDIEKAKEFYGSTMGLPFEDSMGGIRIKFAGGSEAFVYPKPDHIPATFTILNFMVEHVEAEVDDLISKGITFEQYDHGYMKTDAKGIFRGDGQNGPTAMAWFKDPAGNFLSIIQVKK